MWVTKNIFGIKLATILSTRFELNDSYSYYSSYTLSHSCISTITVGRKPMIEIELPLDATAVVCFCSLCRYSNK